MDSTFVGFIQFWLTMMNSRSKTLNSNLGKFEEFCLQRCLATEIQTSLIEKNKKKGQ